MCEERCTQNTTQTLYIKFLFYKIRQNTDTYVFEENVNGDFS